MRRHTQCCALLTMVATLAACAARTPDPAPMPAPEPTSTARSRPRAPLRPSVQNIKWRDRTYVLDEKDVGEMFAGTFPVENGIHEWKHDEDDYGWFHVTEAEYGDIDGDGHDEAAVIVTWNGGGSGKFSLGIVFGYPPTSDELAIRGVIPGGDRADGGLRSLAIEQGSLIAIRNATTNGACCPTGAVRETWQWTGTAFKEDESARQSVPID